jgi:hypothetical protein
VASGRQAIVDRDTSICVIQMSHRDMHSSLICFKKFFHLTSHHVLRKVSKVSSGQSDKILQYLIVPHTIRGTICTVLSPGVINVKQLYSTVL